MGFSFYPTRQIEVLPAEEPAGGPWSGPSRSWRYFDHTPHNGL